MKIHIDTSPPSSKTKEGGKPSSKKTPAASPTSSPTSPANTSQSTLAAKPKPKPKVPTRPPKEPKRPKDVASAIKQQSNALKARQQKEVGGKQDGAPRQVDAGYGFYPPLSPFM